MAFAEDLSVFFDVDIGFAVTAQRTPAVGGTSPDADVIFDANGLDVPELEVVTSEPALVVPLSSWPDLADDDLITIGADSFKVRQAYPQRDGAIAVAILAKL